MSFATNDYAVNMNGESRTEVSLSSRMIRIGILSAACLLGLSLGTAAQPRWVKDMVDLAQTVKVDKDATVVVLSSSKEVKIGSDGHSIAKIRRAVKVLSPAGSEKAILSELTSPTRKIKNIEGWLVRENGTVEDMKKDWIGEMDATYRAGYYDDNRSLVASFPGVESGDVVAFEYKVVETDALLGRNQRFVLQFVEPTIRSEFTVEIPGGWALFQTGRHSDETQRIRTKNGYTWLTDRLDYQPIEPFMPQASDILRWIEVSAYDPTSSREDQFADWGAVATWTHDLQQPSNAVDEQTVSAARQLCEGLTDPVEQMTAIAQYVRDKIRYVAVELGAGRFEPRQPHTTQQNGYGDCKDKTALMRAMLKAVDIPSEAVLANTRRPIDPDFPCPLQFNHVIIGIPISDYFECGEWPTACIDGWLYYDPTDDRFDLGHISSQLRGTFVLRTSEKDSSVLCLPELSPTDYERLNFANIELSPDGSILARVRTTYYGLLAAETAFGWKSRAISEWTKDQIKRFARAMQDPRITEIRREVADDSVWVSFVLEGRNMVSESGGRSLLKADIFHADQTNSLVGKRRVHPVSFGKPRLEQTIIAWQLPPDWRAGTPPSPITDSCEIASISSQIEVREGEISFLSRVEYLGGELEDSAYKTAKAFTGKVRAAESTRVFLTKGDH